MIYTPPPARPAQPPQRSAIGGETSQDERERERESE